MEEIKTYFIIHGVFGYSAENWFPWLENTLKARNQKVYNFDYPTPRKQGLESWSKVLNNVKHDINEKSVFICHGIGCLFLARYCVENKIKIGKAIFVSGYNNYKISVKMDRANMPMFVDYGQLFEFKDYCPERICIYSVNDHIVSPKHLMKFAKALDSKMVVYSDAGHFNALDGFTKFEDILEFI